MPTNDETQQQRYQREHNDHLKALAKYTPEQIAAVEVDLNNATATIAQLRAVLRGLVDDIQGLIAESDGVAGLHRNGDVAPWGELEAGGQFEWLSHLPAAIEAAQCSEVGRKCSEQCAELPAPPVPRDVLMEMGRSVERVIISGGYVALNEKQLCQIVDAIADRYASKVQPERSGVTLEEVVSKLKGGENGDAISEAMTQATADMALGRAIRERRAKKPEQVNQQLLVSLKDCEARLALLVAAGRGKLLDAVAAEKARAAIAAAEQAHADHIVDAKKMAKAEPVAWRWRFGSECMDTRWHYSDIPLASYQDRVIEMLYTHPPAVAVPDDWHAAMSFAGAALAEAIQIAPLDRLPTMAGAAMQQIDALLSAAQKPEGV